MKDLILKNYNRSQITLVRGEVVRDHSIFPPLNEVVAVAMLFAGAMMVFIS